MTANRKRRVDDQDQVVINILDYIATSQPSADSFSQQPQYNQNNQHLEISRYQGPYAPALSNTATHAGGVYVDPAFVSNLPTSPRSTWDQMYPTPAVPRYSDQYTNCSTNAAAIAKQYESMLNNHVQDLAHYNATIKSPFAPVYDLNGQFTRPILTPQQAVQYQTRAHRTSRMSPQSEPLLSSGIGNTVARGSQTDSGYVTLSTKSPANGSRFVLEPMPSIPDCSSLSLDTNDNCLPPMGTPLTQIGTPLTQVDFTYNAYPDLKQKTVQDFVSHSMTSPQMEGPPWKCPECPDLEIKNRSELKKHFLRHIRPFVCLAPDCRRVVGFSTKNDLDRHRKSVHGIAPIGINDRTFRCCAPDCTKAMKIWPRADNFKQHCSRVHKGMNVPELLARSWVQRVPPQRSPLNLNSEDFAPDLVPVRQSEVNQRSIESSLPSSQCVADPQDRSFPPSTGTDVNSFNDDHAVRPSSAPVAIPASPRLGDGVAVDTHPVNTNDATGSLHHGPSPSPANPLPVGPGSKTVIHKYRNRPSKELSLPRNQGGNSIEVPVSPKATEKVSEDLISELIKCIAAEEFTPDDTEASEGVKALIRNRFSILLDTDKTIPRNESPTCSREGQLQCHYCPKIKKSASDLKKHEKRHTRPYGCTYTSCCRHFGSKNDWKRHENTMHYQTESWRCSEPKLDDPVANPPQHRTTPTCSQQPAPKTPVCAVVFYRKESYICHLESAHHLTSRPDIKARCKRNHVGNNGQKAFWCGFCQAIIKLDKKGLEAWDERFSHIDDEHYKKGMKVGDWWPLGAKGCKSWVEARAEEEEEEEEEEAEDGVRVSSSLEDDANETIEVIVVESEQEEEEDAEPAHAPSPPHHQDRSSIPIPVDDTEPDSARAPAGGTGAVLYLDPRLIMSTPAAEYTPQQTAPHAEPSLEMITATESAKRGGGGGGGGGGTRVWYCCQCGGGPKSCALFEQCTDCVWAHERCQGCRCKMVG